MLCVMSLMVPSCLSHAARFFAPLVVVTSVAFFIPIPQSALLASMLEDGVPGGRPRTRFAAPYSLRSSAVSCAGVKQYESAPYWMPPRSFCSRMRRRMEGVSALAPARMSHCSVRSLW